MKWICAHFDSKVPSLCRWRMVKGGSSTGAGAAAVRRLRSSNPTAAAFRLRRRRALHPDQLACLLVPGLAIDHRGVRLGYGGGYYDRLRQQPPWRAVPSPGGAAVRLHHTHATAAGPLGHRFRWLDQREGPGRPHQDRRIMSVTCCPAAMRPLLAFLTLSAACLAAGSIATPAGAGSPDRICLAVPRRRSGTEHALFQR